MKKQDRINIGEEPRPRAVSDFFPVAVATMNRSRLLVLLGAALSGAAMGGDT